jgi:hypothetical protein
VVGGGADPPLDEWVSPDPDPLGQKNLRTIWLCCISRAPGSHSKRVTYWDKLLERCTSPCPDYLVERLQKSGQNTVG